MLVTDCFSKVADVFFILDSSSSIYVEDYKQVLQFVSQVITRFDVSSDDTRIGALTFSDDYQVRVTPHTLSQRLFRPFVLVKACQKTIAE